MSETHTPPSSEKRDEIAERSATMPNVTLDKKYKLRGYDYPVRVLCVDAKGPWPVRYLYAEGGGEEFSGRARADGTSGCAPGSFNLIEVQEPVTFWLNVYVTRNGKVYAAAAVHDTRESADHLSGNSRLACISATYDPNKV